MKKRYTTHLKTVLIILISAILLTLVDVIVRYAIQKIGLIDTRFLSAADSDDLFILSIINGFLWNFFEVGWLFLLFSTGIVLLIKNCSFKVFQEVGIAAMGYMAFAVVFILFNYRDDFNQLFLESAFCAIPIAYFVVLLARRNFKIHRVES